MVNSFLTKHDIVKLLGLDLSEEEREKYMKETSAITVRKAFYTLYREGYIEEELFNQIEPIILSEEDYDITNELGHLSEKLYEYILVEANEYKKLSLLEQIEKFLEYIKQKNITDIEIKNVIQKLYNSVQNNGKNFETSLDEYNKLKKKYEYKS